MNQIMKARYRIYRRERGVFYLYDRQTGKRESLETADAGEASRLLHARNEAQQEPSSIARSPGPTWLPAIPPSPAAPGRT